MKYEDLGEKIVDSELATKLLRLVSRKFDGITSPIKQFQDIGTLVFDEDLGSPNINEVKERSEKREEKALLAWALDKIKKKDDDFAQGKGRGRDKAQGREHGCSSHSKDDLDDEDELESDNMQFILEII